MGDNIVIVEYQTLPYNADSLISLYHDLDPEHSIVQGFQCISWRLVGWKSENKHL